jgi:hypothetical protein
MLFAVGIGEELKGWRFNLVEFRDWHKSGFLVERILVNLESDVKLLLAPPLCNKMSIILLSVTRFVVAPPLRGLGQFSLRPRPVQERGLRGAGRKPGRPEDRGGRFSVTPAGVN